MHGESLTRRFQLVQAGLQALVQNLEYSLAQNAAEDASPDVAARLEKARSLALHAASRLNEYLDEAPCEKFQQLG